MKKLSFILIALICCLPMFGVQRAFYVKKGDTYTKFNFGVASDLKFSDGGKKLTVTGYNEEINLEDIDYITFSPEVDEMALTPAAQKERMVQIGVEALGKIDLEKMHDLLRLIDNFFEGKDIMDGEGYVTDRTNSPFDYYIPAEYLKKKDSIKKLMQSMRTIAKGNPVAIRAFRNAALEVYRASDYFGVYTANAETETWDKTSEANYLEIRYCDKDDNTKYFWVRATCSDDFNTYTEDGTTIEVPKTINLSFNYEVAEVATAVVATTIDANGDMVMTVTADVADYHVVNRMDVTAEKLLDTVDVTIAGNYYMHVVADVEGQDLNRYIQIAKDIRDCSERWDEDTNDYIDGNSDALVAHFRRANADVDLMKKLQVKGKMFNFGLMYDRFSEDDSEEEVTVPGGYVWSRGKILNWDEDAKIMSISADKTSVIDNKVNYLLNYSDFQFFYDETPNIQGFLSWEMDDPCDEYEEYPDESYGYIDLDGFLVNVAYDFYTDENMQNDKRVWGYWVYTDSGSEVRFVDEGVEIIHPTIMRTYYHEVMPVILFPDLSSFSFSEFFDSDAFQQLITDYDEFIATYQNIVGLEK